MHWPPVCWSLSSSSWSKAERNARCRPRSRSRPGGASSYEEHHGLDRESRGRDGRERRPQGDRWRGKAGSSISGPSVYHSLPYITQPAMPPNSSMEDETSTKCDRATMGGIYGLGNNPRGKDSSTANVRATASEASHRLAFIIRTIAVPSKVHSAPRSNWKGMMSAP